jgi:hypothetical protein
MCLADEGIRSEVTRGPGKRYKKKQLICTEPSVDSSDAGINQTISGETESVGDDET